MDINRLYYVTKTDQILSNKMSKIEKLTFSGHETFHCRSLWLKKGYDFLKEGKKFTDESAIGELGVGKNMVSSIRYWLRSFGITDNNDNLLEDGPGVILFEDNFDPYLENHASLWLLHYFLVKSNKASIYNLVFNFFRKERVEFSRDHIYRFLKRYCEETSYPFNDKTIINDINVFIKTYYRPVQVTKNIEDEFSGLLIELNLLKLIRNEESVVIPKYSIENSDRDEIPWQYILYAILDFTNESIMSFNDLMTKPNSPGLVFALSANGLMKKIQEIINHNKNIHFTDDYGIRELRIIKRIHKSQLLRKYYDPN